MLQVPRIEKNIRKRGGLYDQIFHAVSVMKVLLGYYALPLLELHEFIVIEKKCK